MARGCERGSLRGRGTWPWGHASAGGGDQGRVALLLREAVLLVPLAGLEGFYPVLRREMALLLSGSYCALLGQRMRPSRLRRMFRELSRVAQLAVVDKRAPVSAALEASDLARFDHPEQCPSRDSRLVGSVIDRNELVGIDHDRIWSQ